MKKMKKMKKAKKTKKTKKMKKMKKVRKLFSKKKLFCDDIRSSFNSQRSEK